MANRMFISTENIKTMIKQYQDNTPRMIIARYTPKDSDDTLVLVSELKLSYSPKGYLLYWANEKKLNAKTETEEMSKALQELGMPF